MKIKIDDIPEGGMQVNADSEHTAWLKNSIIEAFGPDRIKDGDGARADIQLFRHERNVTVIGGIVLKFHPLCDRCLTVFQKQEQIPIHQVMLPHYKDLNKKDKPEADDEDLSYYQGDEIDLAEIIKEYIILAQGMVNWCTSDCKGLCQTCGKNLNNGACKCKQKEKKISPFAVLKKKKIPA